MGAPVAFAISVGVLLFVPAAEGTEACPCGVEGSLSPEFVSGKGKDAAGVGCEVVSAAVNSVSSAKKSNALSGIGVAPLTDAAAPASGGVVETDSTGAVIRCPALIRGCQSKD